MKSQDNYPAAVKISEETIKFLAQYEVAPTPVNFSVIYHYLSKTNELVTNSIDEYINWNGSLDAVFIETVFLDFFSHTEELEESLLTPFEDALSSTMDKLKTQVVNGKEIATHFKKADSVLAKSSNSSSLQPLVKFITTTLANSQNQHKQLSEELTETYQQVKQLKTQLKASREEAIRDALTGLYNRRGCDEKLEELSVEDVHTSFVIDIDHFKNINDNFGHAIGDNVIQKVATTIQSHISDTDFAVRCGGEEFLVVVNKKAGNDAKTIAEKIRIAITKLKLKHRKTNTYLPSISVSIGIAEHQPNASWKSVFEMADSALYQAKSAGRNCCIAI